MIKADENLKITTSVLGLVYAGGSSTTWTCLRALPVTPWYVVFQKRMDHGVCFMIRNRSPISLPIASAAIRCSLADQCLVLPKLVPPRFAYIKYGCKDP